MALSSALSVKDRNFPIDDIIGDARLNKLYCLAIDPNNYKVRNFDKPDE